MGVNSVQVALNATTPTPLFVQGGGVQGDGTFKNLTGAVGDEFPTIIANTSASVVVYLGPSTVTTSTGFPLQPNASIPVSWLGTDAGALFGLAASATPSVAILAGRQ